MPRKRVRCHIGALRRSAALFALALAATVCPAFSDAAAPLSQATSLAIQARQHPVGSAERAETIRLAARCALAATVEFFASPESANTDWLTVQRALVAVSELAGPVCRTASVPYVPQANEALCATACVQMALRYLGIPATERESLPLAGSRAAIDGVHLSRVGDIIAHYGARAIIGQGTIELLRCALAAGFPVLVHQYASMNNDVEHMRVIVGFDDVAGTYDSLDPAQDMGPHLTIPRADFDLLWAVPWRDDGAAQWLCIVYAGPGQH